jgi:hypothetical protein
MMDRSSLSNSYSNSSKRGLLIRNSRRIISRPVKPASDRIVFFMSFYCHKTANGSKTLHLFPLESDYFTIQELFKYHRQDQFLRNFCCIFAPFPDAMIASHKTGHFERKLIGTLSEIPLSLFGQKSRPSFITLHIIMASPPFHSLFLYGIPITAEINNLSRLAESPLCQ